MFPDPFSGKLLPGERIAWSGRPRQGVFLSPRDTVLIPFSLMWGGFSIAWEVLALRASPFMAIWGIPFVLIGLFIISGRFLADAYVRAHLFYAVTNRRALIVRLGRFPAFTALSLETLPAVSLEGGNGGRGTIYLGFKPQTFGRNAGQGLLPSLSSTPVFLAIEDATAVLALLSAPRSASPGDFAVPFRSDDGMARVNPAASRPATQYFAVFALVVPAILAGLVFARYAKPPGAFSGGAFQVVRTFAVTDAAYDRGERTPVDHFARDDTAMVLLVLNWPDKWRSRGFHNVEWHWIRDGHIVFTTRYNHMNFSDSPFTLRTWRTARDLGGGHFHVDTLIDGKVAGTAAFDVDAPASGSGQGGL